MRKVISGLCLVTLFCAAPLSAWSVGEDDPLWKHETFGKKVYQVGHRLMDANGIKEHVGFTA